MTVVSRTHTAAAVLVAIASVLAPTAEASAQQRGGAGNKIQTVRIDIHADLGWWWAFGAGLRVDIPIVPDGFIDSIEDEFAISPGIETGFVRWNYGPGYRCGNYGCFNDWSVWPHVVAQWNLYVTNKWSIFPELGGSFVFFDCANGGVCASGSPVAGFGARWHFAPPRVALLFRIIYPFGFQFGITF